MAKKKSAIMVVLSSAIIAPMSPSPALAGIMVSCPVIFQIGKIAKCNAGGRVTVDPDGVIKSIIGCANLLDTPVPAKCVVKTDGSVVIKNVVVDFQTTSITMSFGGDNFVLDKLRMTYTGKTTPTHAITLTPAEVLKPGVTINVGGRLNPTGGHTVNNSYSGDIVIRANTL